MTTIWKFPVLVQGRFTISMPEGARLLSVQMQARWGKFESQEKLPYLWASLDPSRPAVDRHFAVRTTGEEILEHIGTYVGTFQIGAYVFHLYEVD